MDRKELLENALLQTEMPEHNECNCRENLTYNPESEKCKKCVGAQKIKSNMFMAALLSGRMDIIAMMMSADAETQKD